MSTRNILVVGATGKQGGSTIEALLSLPPSSPPIHVFALTRNSSSPSAQALLAKYNREGEPARVALVQGDSRKPVSIFEAHKGVISVVYIVTVPSDEEAQAVPLIDAAIADGGVDHIVFTSVERGGDEHSWENPTDVPHFVAKHKIELHLRDAVEKANGDSSREGKKVRWTIFRPTAFMDNFNPGGFGAVMAALISTMPPDVKVPIISVHDVGVFAALAISKPDDWAGKATGLAGDSLTLAETKEVFKQAIGKELPQTWGVLAKGMRWAIAELGKMFNFFEKEGYQVDIEALKKINPGLQNFETWLKESSKWKADAK